MFGAIAIVVVVVVVLPVSFMMSGAAVSAILGFLLKQTADAAHEGSELIDLNT